MLATACGSSSSGSAGAGAKTSAATTAASATAAPTTATVATSAAAASSAAPAPAATTAAKAACTGKPIKLTYIATLSGPVAFPSQARDVADGVKAGVTSVNAECKSGRPLDIAVCDDKSDANESQACGRKAKGDGSLAIFGGVGTFDGATAAELPMLLTGGTNPVENTNPNAYPGGSALTLIFGSITAAASAGVKDYLMVALDAAAVRGGVQLAQAVAEGVGIKMDTLYFPPDTTDFAPIAAQISARRPGAIGMIVPPMVPFIKALDAEGIHPTELPMFTAVSLIPPDVIKALGTKLDGVYLISLTAPAQDSSNAGIKQMLAEYQAAGIKTDQAEIGNIAVDVWSKTHMVADALGKLGADKAAAIDSAGLVAAVTGAGPITRPEFTPLDFSKPAFPENPVLSALRIFSRSATVVRVDKGTYKSVAPFGDVTKPFQLKTG